MRPTFSRAAVTRALLAASVPLSTMPAHAARGTVYKGFKRLNRIEFIAALGDPKASRGTGAGQSVRAAPPMHHLPPVRRIPRRHLLMSPPSVAGSRRDHHPVKADAACAGEWGIWHVDPGPRGVQLSDYARLEKAGGVAPAKWKFDKNDWWLEEHGLIMEKPDFPLAPGTHAPGMQPRSTRDPPEIHPRCTRGTARAQHEEAHNGAAPTPQHHRAPPSQQAAISSPVAARRRYRSPYPPTAGRPAVVVVVNTPLLLWWWCPRCRCGGDPAVVVRSWELEGGATLYDVTHLPCRAARCA